MLKLLSFSPSNLLSHLWGMQKQPSVKFGDLPNELQRDIVSDLSSRNQFSIRSTNKSLYNATNPEIKRVKIANADDLQKVIKTLPNIEHINLSNCHDLTKSHMATLRKFPHLQAIDLSGNRSVTTRVLSKAPRKIKNLNISNCVSINDDSLQVIRRFKKLRRLTLSLNANTAWDEGINGIGFHHIAAMKNLHIDIKSTVSAEREQDIKAFLAANNRPYTLTCVA